MDNTQLMYLLGAFLIGFFIAWFAGRNGPKRALEDCETESDSLRRSLEEQKRVSAKLEAQVKDGQSQIDGLTADKAKLTEMLKASEKGLTDASAELGRLQTTITAMHGDRLLLEAELGHTRGAYASARAQAATLTALAAVQTEELEEAEEELAEERTAEVEAVGEATAAEETLQEVIDEAGEEVSEETQLVPVQADLEALSDEVDALKAELSAARAAAERLSAEKAIRAELLGASRAKYFDMVSDPERAVIALQERDMAIIEAQSKAEYLRRDLGRLSSSGAEMARALNKRNREYEILLAHLSELTAAEPSRLVDFAATATAVSFARQAAERPEAAVTTAEIAEEQETQPDYEAALAAQTAVAAELQKRLEALQSELEDFRAQVDSLQHDKTDLEAQLQTREEAVTDLNDQLASLQETLASLQAENSDLADRLQARDAGLGDVLAQINALDIDLSALADAPTDTETPPETAETGSDDGAPATDAQSDPIDAAKQGLAGLSTGVAAAAAALQNKQARIASIETALDEATKLQQALQTDLDGKDHDLADLQAKLDSLSNDLASRSAKFDAVSLRSNSLEADLEIERINHAKFEDQVAQVASQLRDLADEFAEEGALAGFKPEAAPASEGEVADTATPVDLGS